MLYAIDSSVYVAAFRAADRMTALRRFLMRAGTRVRVSAVVARELRAGATSRALEEAVEDLFAPYAVRDRVLVPSFDAYLHAGRVLAAARVRDRYPAAAASRSFVRDALLAASCREADATLVTENGTDFARIQRHLRGFRWTSLSDVS